MLSRSSSIRLGSPDGSGAYVHKRTDKSRAAQNYSGKKIVINRQAELLNAMGEAHPRAAADIKKALAKKKMPAKVVEALKADGMNTRAIRSAVIKRFNTVEKDAAKLQQDAAASEPPPQNEPQ